LGRLVAPFLRHAAKRGFQSTLSSCVRRHGDPARLADFHDFAAALETRMKRYRRCSAEADDQARDVIDYAARRGLIRLADDVQKWRHALARQVSARMAVLESVGGGGRLTIPFPMPTEINGCRILFLDSCAAMVQEGLTMEHCIASLYPACARGERLAFSIRDATNRAVATFDVSFTALGEHFDVGVNELSGPKNSDASPAAAELVATFRRTLQERSKEQANELRAWLASRSTLSTRMLEREQAKFIKQAEQAAIEPFAALFRSYV
jgi:hypothetical protein